MININLPKQSAVIILAAIASLVVLTFLQIVRNWHNDWTLTHQQMTNDSVIMTKTDSAPYEEIIANAHLFGQILGAGQIPLTSLQLKLTGIVKSDSEGKDSKAYISLSGKTAKIYHIGDILSYGVKILDITAGAVMLENNGQVEKVLLPREPLAFKKKKNEESLE